MTYRTNKDIIEWSSMLALSTLIFFNLISIIIYLVPKDFVILLKHEVFYGSLLIIVIANYFIFIKDQKYKKIIEIFKNEKKILFIVRSLFMVCYIFASVYIFIYLIKHH
jgi:hypothetical protein